MEVVGKSKAKIVIESCLRDSSTYFSDHERIIRCNPYCTHVVHMPEDGMYKWVFQVKDPRNNPIVAVFFVRQIEEDGNFPSPHAGEAPGGMTGRCIRWVSADSPEGEEFPEEANTFVGRTDSKICLYHLAEGRTEVHFETDIVIDFELSFPLNMMPEGILKFMTEAVMSQIMQQATESMLAQVQSDICCSDAELEAGGGRV
ncbi:DUF1997 domain-containing protein [Pelodictyon luteolum]|uniref:DUF1997 domain-containing protein n=1 Tax=Chlorobium luteolum (strain DSM 273 / BCRC 81028 / 2530) TaxID=319225 RepID=Q3B1D6_CHLL3|nr:DUF1997 domain-containing protein [Pelodictyon luteolum]ABB24845.1 conserved hypothetical protein [Pelodictyon luteolum DSM 273]